MMNTYLKIISYAAVFCLAAYSYCFPETSGKINIVATTTHIGSILSEIGGEKVGVITVVPGGMCPGHFDIKPNTARRISKSDIFITNTYEKWAGDLFARSERKKSLKYEMSTRGSWMLPDVNITAAEEIMNLLAEYDEANENYYRKNYVDYVEKVRTAAKNIKESVSFEGIRVICSEMQKDFAEWLGFSVLKTYGRPEDLTLQQMAGIAYAGKNENVELVIDNLQSGGSSLKQLSKEINAAHVTLTNFPLDGSYINTLINNTNLIKQALK